MKPTQDEQTFAAMLEGMAADAPEDMARMAALARALEHVRPATGPAPMAFRNALRNRLVLEMAARRTLLERIRDGYAERNARMRRSFKFVFANAVAAVFLLAGGSVMAMANSAVPGDWDYFAKRLHEEARLLITRGPESRAYLQMDLARERLDEVRTLVDRKQTATDPYMSALNDMDLRTLDATELLIKAYGQSQNRVPLERLTRFAQAQRFGLEMIVDRLPAGARPPARDSLDILERVSQRVTGIMAGCLCPANSLLPATDAAPDLGGSGSTDAATSGQAPVCACSRYRSGPAAPATGNGTSSGRDPSNDPGTQPPATGNPDTGVLPDVPGVSADDEINQLVNDLIDDVIEPLLEDTPLPVPLPSGLPSGLFGN